MSKPIKKLTENDLHELAAYWRERAQRGEACIEEMARQRARERLTGFFPNDNSATRNARVDNDWPEYVPIKYRDLIVGRVRPPVDR